MTSKKINQPNELGLAELEALHEADELLGEFYNVSEEAYHAGPGLSRSDLAKVIKSPEHLEYAKQEEKTETTALLIGNALHCFILEPEKFERTFFSMPEGMRRDKRVKAYKTLIENLEDHQKLLSFEEMESIIAMGTRFKEHPVCAKFLDGSMKEVTYYWKDPHTNLLLKARLDIVHPELGVMDIKTTAGDARRTEFSKACLKYNYDLQAAHYWAGAIVSQQKNYPFYFGVIEKAEPHGIVVHKADLGFIECGLEIQQFLLEKLDNYLKGKESFSYPTDIVNLSLPPWGFDLDARLERYK